MSGAFVSRGSYLVLASLCLAAGACGSDSPTPPTPAAPTPTTTAVQVRAAGDASGPLEAGQTRQLVATATQSTGSTSDVTQQATWQSSAPGVATVSSTGLVTAVAEGDADISATYQSVKGTMGVGVRPVPCAGVTLPRHRHVRSVRRRGQRAGPGERGVVPVDARSDAPWLPFAFEPTGPGSAIFSYTAPANSTTEPRTANIVVTTATGESTMHTVTVNRTTGCSYVTDPEEAVFTAAGGTGQFRVVTTPNNCQWNLVNGMQALGVQITSGFSGTGAATVRYSVQAHTRDVDADGYLEIAGLSGRQPERPPPHHHQEALESRVGRRERSSLELRMAARVSSGRSAAPAPRRRLCSGIWPPPDVRHWPGALHVSLACGDAGEPGIRFGRARRTPRARAHQGTAAPQPLAGPKRAADSRRLALSVLTEGLHDLASVTKSMTSVLVGIAIDKGLIDSVRQPVVSLLPAAVRGKADAQLRAMTVENLLTMTSGLDCGFEPRERELAAMRRSDNWPAFALALPMRAAPGTHYAYCSCNNHLLSAILSARTGESALAFARTHLFDPLGISAASWPADSHGQSHGWGDLHLFPKDLARIGELYRNGGTWKGRRIVSESWVRQSTRPLVRVRDGVGYGYSWWINTARTPAIYEAVGRGGQRVAVVPDKELVIVFNGGGVDTDEIAPMLLAALRSDHAIAVRAGGPARLAVAMVEVRQPPAAGRRREAPAGPNDFRHDIRRGRQPSRLAHAVAAVLR